MQVRLYAPGESGADFGTGYLVAPRLVLTAAHTIGTSEGEAPGKVTVERPVPRPLDGPWTAPAVRGFAGTVQWYRYDDLIDAALIEVDQDDSWPVPESLADLTDRPPQRWGHFIGSRPCDVSVVGYPRHQRDGVNGQRIDEGLPGEVSPRTGSLARRYEIFSTYAPPAGGEGSPWAGMSGAAVRAGDLLCGVVCEDRLAVGGVRLTAVPVSLLIADEAFRGLIEKHSGGWTPVLEPVEPTAGRQRVLSPAAVERRLDSPAGLLRADAEAVPFHGREAELAELTAWCTDGRAALSARVLVGPGGQGKSRLARQLTTDLAHTGWVTGHLDPRLRDGVPYTLDVLETELPMLLVVDYAETRPELVRDVTAFLQESRHRVRLLLIARADGEWRTDTLTADYRTRSVLNTAVVMALGPLVPRGGPKEERLEAFRDAAGHLARLLPAVPGLPSHPWAELAATVEPLDGLDGPRYDNALTLQMTALATLLQNGPRPVPVAAGEGAEGILQAHEGRFWHESARTPAFRLDLGDTLKDLVAVAALCGAADVDEALAVVAAVPELPAEKRRAAVQWLARLYPPAPDRFWGSLQPDRVAEFHASDRVVRGGVKLPAVLAAATPDQQGQLVTVLARAAVAHYDNDRQAPSRDVLDALDTALDRTPLHFDALRPAALALADPARIVAPLALRLIRERIEGLRLRVADDPVAFEPLLGRARDYLATCLARAGDLHGAVVEGRAAVELLERHGDADRETRAAWARSLTNLGIHLSEVGRWDEGLAAAEAAVRIARELTNAVPADSGALEDLAGTLNNLGLRLSEVGRAEDSLEAAREAVAIDRRLTGLDPATHARGLARGLLNLGNRLAESGKWEEALQCQQEAVDTVRRLAASSPAAYESDLADVLISLGTRFSELGRWPEALAAEGEAVAIMRRLVPDNPAVHEPGLALALSNLGNFLSDLGRWPEALVAVAKAVEIYRRRAADRPTVLRPQLAMALHNLANHWSDAGDQDTALARMEAAVEIRRELAAELPAVHEQDYAVSLFNLGVRLRGAGRPVDGVRAVEQALEIYRRPRPGDDRTRGRALALLHLAGALPALGRGAEARAAAEEAAGLYRTLAETTSAFEDEHAGLLASLANLRREAGPDEEWLAPAEESVRIYRGLVDERPGLFEDRFALALRGLGAKLMEAGRFAEAVETEDEAVRLLRRLVAGDPSMADTLAFAVISLAACLWELERPEESVAATEEAIGAFRPLAAADPAVFEPVLAEALYALALRLGGTPERHDEGRAAIVESVEMFRGLAGRDVGAFGLPAAHALALAAGYRSAYEEFAEALALLSEAEELYEELDRLRPGAHREQRDALAAGRREIEAHLGGGAGQPDV
ncbi:tetratricopeptide repeat-containing serine protease family protein [Kitasatospora sp. CM 4170]|uniref:Tetratricopeptide repeat-containing serine protease family protein n=1 Tax=Kitasatospora aburaviensis TaxID=67265 RepID=A0ABW1EXX0_9ACTN|nr:tetratricopeptide repeat-containing serine protease family protein [Kitasatospora sp. CM 4170]WNM49529.1 tetratricopeptide repeat-containing serine protease family protein [Kitasatospora sp. CM 4170]